MLCKEQWTVPIWCKPQDTPTLFAPSMPEAKDLSASLMSHLSGSFNLRAINGVNLYFLLLVTWRSSIYSSITVNKAPRRGLKPTFSPCLTKYFSGCEVNIYKYFCLAYFAHCFGKLYYYYYLFIFKGRVQLYSEVVNIPNLPSFDRLLNHSLCSLCSRRLVASYNLQAIACV